MSDDDITKMNIDSGIKFASYIINSKLQKLDNLEFKRCVLKVRIRYFERGYVLHSFLCNRNGSEFYFLKAVTSQQIRKENEELNKLKNELK